MTIYGSKTEPVFLFIKRTQRKLTLNVPKMISKIYFLTSCLGFFFGETLSFF